MVNPGHGLCVREFRERLVQNLKLRVAEPDESRADCLAPPA